jgi:hypothetical protein
MMINLSGGIYISSFHVGGKQRRFCCCCWRFLDVGTSEYKGINQLTGWCGIGADGWLERIPSVMVVLMVVVVALIVIWFSQIIP